MELDLRVEEDRYIDAATLDRPGQRRSRTPTTTGTGASSSPTSSATPPPRPPCTARSALLDEAGIRGELKLRDYRTGRVETTQMWGRPGVGAPGVPPPAPAVSTVVALFDDLLLGSNVLGMLRAAGHEARLTGDAAAASPDGAAVLIVDLAQPGLRRRRRRRGACAPAASWATRARSASTRTSTPTPSAAPTPPASTSSSRARAWRARARSSWSGWPVPDVLRPLFDQVVIKELEPDRMRRSGLLVPEGTQRRPAQRGHRPRRRRRARPSCRTSRCRSSPATTSCSRARPACGSRSRTSACSCAACARSSA